MARTVKITKGAAQWPIYPSNPPANFSDAIVVHPALPGFRVQKRTARQAVGRKFNELPEYVLLLKRMWEAALTSTLCRDAAGVSLVAAVGVEDTCGFCSCSDMPGASEGLQTCPLCLMTAHPMCCDALVKNAACSSDARLPASPINVLPNPGPFESQRLCRLCRLWLFGKGVLSAGVGSCSSSSAVAAARPGQSSKIKQHQVILLFLL